MRSRVLRHLGILLPGVAVALILVCGCGRNEPASPAGPAPTTTAPSSTLGPEEEGDEQALTRLAEGWFEAIRRIFIDGEDLATAEQYVAGEYLEVFRQQVVDQAERGQRSERDPEDRTRTTVEDVSITGDEATVTECVINADVLVDGESGVVIDDSVGVRRYRTVAERTDAGWRFVQRTSVPIEEDDDSCPEQ